MEASDEFDETLGGSVFDWEEYAAPVAVVVCQDAAGNDRVLVAGRKGQLTLCECSGDIVRSWMCEVKSGDEVAVGAVAVKDLNVYVADVFENKIFVFACVDDLLCSPIHTMTIGRGQGSAPGRLDCPSALAVLSDGSVAVADTMNNRIQVFSESGDAIAQFGSRGKGPGQFDEPLGLCKGPHGTLFVVDSQNHRVQEFDTSGTHLSTFGAKGSGDGELDGPVGVVALPDDTIAVADRGNSRIQVFTDEGEFRWTIKNDGDDDFVKPFALGVASDGDVLVADASHVTWFASDVGGESSEEEESEEGGQRHSPSHLSEGDEPSPRRDASPFGSDHEDDHEGEGDEDENENGEDDEEGAGEAEAPTSPSPTLELSEDDDEDEGGHAEGEDEDDPEPLVPPVSPVTTPAGSTSSALSHPEAFGIGSPSPAPKPRPSRRRVALPPSKARPRPAMTDYSVDDEQVEIEIKALQTVLKQLREEGKAAEKSLAKVQKQLAAAQQELLPYAGQLSLIKAAAVGAKGSKFSELLTPQSLPLDYTECSDLITVEERVMDLQMRIRALEKATRGGKGPSRAELARAAAAQDRGQLEGARAVVSSAARSMQKSQAQATEELNRLKEQCMVVGRQVQDFRAGSRARRVAVEGNIRKVQTELADHSEELMSVRDELEMWREKTAMQSSRLEGLRATEAKLQAQLDA